MRTDRELKLRRAAQRLEPEWDEARAQRVVDGMHRRRRQRRAVRTTVATLLVAAAVFIATQRRGPTETTIALADGSHVALAAADKLVRHVDRSDRVRLELLRGRAQFSVKHDPSRPFRVEAGPLAVEVLGTRFEIDRTETQTTVHVHEGRVAVFTAAGKRVLVTGESTVEPVAVAAAPAAAPPSAAAAASSTATAAAPASPSVSVPASPSAVVPASPSVAAPTAPSITPPVSPPGVASSSSPRPPRPPTAAELLDLADRARETRRPAEAVAPLRRLLELYPRDSRAPLAAFTLGRVLLESLNRPAEAADAFLRAQTPITALHEDALAREVDAAARAGNTARAKMRAEAYVARYPEGPHLHAVRRQGKLE